MPVSLEAVLSDLGQIVAVSSGRVALKVLLDQEVAVVLLDVSMPDIDGFETATLIRRKESLKFLAILLTALLN